MYNYDVNYMFKHILSIRRVLFNQRESSRQWADIYVAVEDVNRTYSSLDSLSQHFGLLHMNFFYVTDYLFTFNKYRDCCIPIKRALMQNSLRK